jgi:hypothetical protein
MTRYTGCPGSLGLTLVQSLQRLSRDSMCAHSDTRSNFKYLAYSPVQEVFRALGTDVTREGSCSSKHSAILEEFLQSQQRGRKVSAHQADPNVPSPSSIAKLKQLRRAYSRSCYWEQIWWVICLKVRYLLSGAVTDCISSLSAVGS